MWTYKHVVLRWIKYLLNFAWSRLTLNNLCLCWIMHGAYLHWMKATMESPAWSRIPACEWIYVQRWTMRKIYAWSCRGELCQRGKIVVCSIFINARSIERWTYVNWFLLLIKVKTHSLDIFACFEPMLKLPSHNSIFFFSVFPRLCFF